QLRIIEVNATFIFIHFRGATRYGRRKEEPVYCHADRIGSDVSTQAAYADAFHYMLTVIKLG
ncbi:MAG: hypothetical protein PVG41_06860, partial [Desulfobacteraceae bacterium]